MKLTRKIKFYPTVEQEEYLWKCIHTRRATWNWALDVVKRGSWDFSIVRQMVSKRRNSREWLQETFAHLQLEVIRDLDKAFKRFFKQQTGYPTFKRRRPWDGSFKIPQNKMFKVDGRHLKFSLFPHGWLKLQEKPPIAPSSVVIKIEAGSWYAVFVHDKPRTSVETTGEVLGVDMGITHLAICSDGQKFENKRFTIKNAKKLKRAQRQLKRKKKGSKRYTKTLKRVRKLHARTKRQRMDWMHKVSHRIVSKRPQAIVLEDLNIKGMIKNRRLAKHIGDAGWYTLRKMIEYKAELVGIKIVIADRFFPSSQITPSGDRKKLPLDVRFALDHKTGVWYDRDINAARNLAHYGRQTLAALSGRGRSIRPSLRAAAVEASTVNI